MCYCTTNCMQPGPYIEEGKVRSAKHPCKIRIFLTIIFVAIVKHVVYRHFTCAHSFSGFMKIARLVVVGRESCFCWAPSTPRKLKETFFLLEERCLKSTSFVYRYRNFITNGDGTAAVSLSSQSSFNNVDVAYHCLAMVRNL